jgi:glutamine cyclotransferase
LILDGKRLYATDGTDRIFVVKPETWEIEKIFNVYNEEGQHVYKLNDLTFVHDKLFIIIYLTRKLI